jgi:hypothetical protein
LAFASHNKELGLRKWEFKLQNISMSRVPLASAKYKNSAQRSWLTGHAEQFELVQYAFIYPYDAVIWLKFTVLTGVLPAPINTSNI